MGGVEPPVIEAETVGFEEFLDKLLAYGEKRKEKGVSQHVTPPDRQM
jgi:hypothetical protein